MPFSSDRPTLPISSILVRRDERQRREFSTDDLEQSISRVGLINPVVIDSDGTLIAGERRLEACRRLGWTDIPITLASDLSPTTSKIIELEENIKREDLPWKDIVLAVAQIHSLHLSQDPDWTMTETAESCSLAKSTVSTYLRISEYLQGGDPRVEAASTHREAYNIILRRDQRYAGDVLESILSQPLPEEVVALPTPTTPTTIVAEKLPPVDPPLEETILNVSFLEWVRSYDGPKFNLLHCDFPYGISFNHGSQGRSAYVTQYEDSQDIYLELLTAFCNSLPRLASISSHILFWYSDRLRDATFATFKELAPQVVFQPFPLIWVKSDNVGIVSDPRRGPRHVYETCLLGTIGDRNIVKVVSDAYACQTDRSLHPSTKPETMLRHFFSMLIDEHSRVFDPTCGSGSSIRAAESLNAAAVLGLELDPDYCSSARAELRKFRILKNARF